MLNARMKLLVAATAVILMGAAGGSSSASSGSSSGGHTYTIGVLTDITGPGASGNKTSVQGVNAGTVLAKKQGYTIKYVVADTTTSPNAVLSAAQKLVQEDHVLAVIGVSALTYSAAPFLTSQGVPVVGVPEDGPEWITSKNMFSVYGPLDTTKVATTAGQFYKMEGVTNVGTLGYSVSPTSAEEAKATAVSAQVAGLRAGYVNATFPFGSTNVQPVALAMKSAGVDGVGATVDPNTFLALVTALRQFGANPKVALSPTGFGGDLTQSGPGAVQAAQNVYFDQQFEPVELNTAATRQFQSALRSVGVTTDPTYAEYAGYTAIALLVQGLQGAGSNPSHASLIKALSGITNFNGAGLLGSRTVNLRQRKSVAVGVDECLWFTKVSGSTFQLVHGADPLCGTIVPGKTVSASS